MCRLLFSAVARRHLSLSVWGRHGRCGGGCRRGRRRGFFVAILQNHSSIDAFTINAGIQHGEVDAGAGWAPGVCAWSHVPCMAVLMHWTFATLHPRYGLTHLCMVSTQSEPALHMYCMRAPQMRTSISAPRPFDTLNVKVHTHWHTVPQQGHLAGGTLTSNC